MKANKELTNLLKFSNKHYQKVVFELFYFWCSTHSYSDRHAQKLISSQKLYDWFLREHKLQEAQFISYTKDYANRATIDLRKFYAKLVIDKLNYPKVLLTKLHREYNKESMKITLLPCQGITYRNLN